MAEIACGFGEGYLVFNKQCGGCGQFINFKKCRIDRTGDGEVKMVWGVFCRRCGPVVPKLIENCLEPAD